MCEKCDRHLTDRERYHGRTECWICRGDCGPPSYPEEVEEQERKRNANPVLAIASVKKETKMNEN